MIRVLVAILLFVSLVAPCLADKPPTARPFHVGFQPATVASLASALGTTSETVALQYIYILATQAVDAEIQTIRARKIIVQELPQALSRLTAKDCEEVHRILRGVR